MALSVDLSNLKPAVMPLIDGCCDIATFSAVGYLSGHVVNILSAWPLKSPWINTLQSTHLQSATLCCALFIAIDRIAGSMFDQIVNKFYQDMVQHVRVPFKPVPVRTLPRCFSVLRIILSGAAAIEITNVFAPHIKEVAPGLTLAKVDFVSAAVIITTALVFYSQLLRSLKTYNERS